MAVDELSDDPLPYVDLAQAMLDVALNATFVGEARVGLVPGRKIAAPMPARAVDLLWDTLYFKGVPYLLISTGVAAAGVAAAAALHWRSLSFNK